MDRLGAAGRVTAVVDPEKLRPLPRDAQGLTLTRELHNIWFSAGSHNVADYAEALRLLLHDPERPGSTFAENIWPFALSNFGFVLLSDQLILPWLNESPAVRFYADSPRIHMFTVGSGSRAHRQESDSWSTCDAITSAA